MYEPLHRGDVFIVGCRRRRSASNDDLGPKPHPRRRETLHCNADLLPLARERSQLSLAVEVVELEYRRRDAIVKVRVQPGHQSGDGVRCECDANERPVWCEPSDAVRRQLELNDLRGRDAGARKGGRRGPPRECRQLRGSRSEEHTSELQSRENLGGRILLEKKKKKVSRGAVEEGREDVRGGHET